MTQELTAGTWIRSLVDVSDSGDFNDRHAKAGALGMIDEVRADDPRGRSYVVVFYPSFILNNWTADEIAREAVVLPENHPDIPSAEAFELTSAVADLVADGDVDEADRTVYATDATVRRIMGNAHVAFDEAPEIREILKASLRPDGVALSFESFDRLAEIAGIGDRVAHLSLEPRI